MARPNKDKLEYFSFDVDFMQDKKIKLVFAKYKAKGVLLFINLICEIYKTNGYYIKIDGDSNIIFADENKLSEDEYLEIIDFFLDKDLFNKDLFEKYNILTSKRIQKNFLSASCRRNNITVFEQYLLIDFKDFIENLKTKNKPILNIIQVNTNNNLVNVDNNSINVDNNTQSKVKESKVKERESKVKKKESKKEDSAFLQNADAVINFYPKKCPIRGASLQTNIPAVSTKGTKDAAKLKPILKKYSLDEIENIIRLYISDCETNRIYFKSFAVFINNFDIIAEDYKNELNKTVQAKKEVDILDQLLQETSETEDELIWDHQKEVYYPKKNYDKIKSIRLERCQKEWTFFDIDLFNEHFEYQE